MVAGTLVNIHIYCRLTTESRLDALKCIVFNGVAVCLKGPLRQSRIYDRVCTV